MKERRGEVECVESTLAAFFKGYGWLFDFTYTLVIFLGFERWKANGVWHGKLICDSQPTSCIVGYKHHFLPCADS